MAAVDWATTGLPLSVSNMLRREAQLERMLRPPAIEALRSRPVVHEAARIHEIVRQSTAGMQESLRGMQGFRSSDAHAAIVRTQEQARSYLAQMQPFRSVVVDMQAQMQNVQEQVRRAFGGSPASAFPAAHEIVRSAHQAAARLSDVDKVRLRNALSHWSGLSERARDDQLALAFATIESWREEGNTRLKSFASVLRKAFDRWLLEAIARSLRRSAVLDVVTVSLRLRVPRFVDRCFGVLRDLKWSISPNAPPACLA